MSFRPKGEILKHFHISKLVRFLTAFKVSTLLGHKRPKGDSE
jgi:hypothetical protein